MMQLTDLAPHPRPCQVCSMHTSRELAQRSLGKRCLSDPNRCLFKMGLLKDRSLIVRLPHHASALKLAPLRLQQTYIMSVLDRHHS
jgi:hypothetical protein